MAMWDGIDLEMGFRSLAQHRRLGIARHTAWEYTFVFGSIATYLFSLLDTAHSRVGVATTSMDGSGWALTFVFSQGFSLSVHWV